MLMRHLLLTAQLQVKHIINHKFNCNGKCLVYLLTCNCCKKEYVGQTVDEFRFRWNNYKSNCRKHQRGETCMQQHLHEHFCSSNHNCFISDVSVTFIDKTDPSDLLKRDYWRSTLKTMAPFGLNVEESVRRSLFCHPCCVGLVATMFGDKKVF